MRYWFWTFAGLLVTGAALVAAAWGLYHVTRIGTCASGGPYVSARPCPAGTGAYILAIMAGVFGGLGGIFLYALRGDGLRPGISIGLLVWTLGFLLLGGAALYSAIGPARAKDSSSGGGIIVAVIFFPLALGGLIAAVKSGGGDDPLPPGQRVMPSPAMFPPPGPGQGTPIVLRPRPGGPVPLAAAAHGAPAAEDDTLARLQKLGDLHANGTLTDEEFATQKKRILGEV
jgi:Short C-terminal domain